MSVVCVGSLIAACEPRASEHPPDALLREELGLTDTDEVYTIRVSGGERERADPPVDTIPVGAWLQFVTTDWFVHEVAFDAGSLSPDVRTFLDQTGQMASPPMIEQDARFVLSFEGAPPGRYPYLLRGNGAEGRGVVHVVASEGR